MYLESLVREIDPELRDIAAKSLLSLKKAGFFAAMKRQVNKEMLESARNTPIDKERLFEEATRFRVLLEVAESLEGLTEGDHFVVSTLNQEE